QHRRQRGTKLAVGRDSAAHGQPLQAGSHQGTPRFFHQHVHRRLLKVGRPISSRPPEQPTKRYNERRGGGMNIPVLLEPVANNGYRARAGDPLGMAAEGATRDEALAKLREQVADRLSKGTQIVTLEIPSAPAENPWVEFAGMFKDDPWIEDWK